MSNYLFDNNLQINGNVGIGIDNPQVKLDVDGHTRINSNIVTIESAGVNNFEHTTLNIIQKTSTNNGTNNAAIIYLTNEGDNTVFTLGHNHGDLQISHKNNSNLWSNPMIIKPDGNVCIGTSTAHSSLSRGLSLGASSSDPKTWSTISYKDSSNSYPPSLTLGQTIYSGIINQSGGSIYFYARNNTDTYYYAIGNSGTVFTGQHSNTGNPTLLKAGENEGLIVECDGTYVDKISINNSWVNVKLTTTNKSPRVYGVISTHSAEEELNDENNVYKDHEKFNFGNDVKLNQIRVNSLGEGAVWISNINGNLLNGDFFVSTTIKGYGGKQDDDILHNYTVGKVLSDCDFTSNNYDKRYITSQGIQITEEEYDENIHYIACFIGCVYYCG